MKENPINIYIRITIHQYVVLYNTKQYQIEKCIASFFGKRNV